MSCNILKNMVTYFICQKWPVLSFQKCCHTGIASKRITNKMSCFALSVPILAWKAHNRGILWNIENCCELHCKNPRIELALLMIFVIIMIFPWKILSIDTWRMLILPILYSEFSDMHLFEIVKWSHLEILNNINQSVTIGIDHRPSCS